MTSPSPRNSACLEPFWVFPVDKAPRAIVRSPGVITVVIASLTVVAAGGLWPSVVRGLEATSEGLADLELWRTVTYVLPHEGGWVHVLVNMFLLCLFGWQLERIVGAGRFLAIYFGSGAVGMCLLFAANPIDADRGIRSGASLAVFGVVAALTIVHAHAGGLRGSAMPWALSTCAVLLIAGGVLSSSGRSDVISSGWQGFWFGFLNHALGMVAGVMMGLAVPARLPAKSRWIATAAATATVVVGLALGAHRWT